jgi:glycine/D-amino acid oxidase-like deaminating enzyme
MKLQTDVAIIGGGVTGLSLAWELHERGRRAMVFEKDYTGAGGSGRNVGRIRAMQLTPELARFAVAAQRKHRELPDQLGMNTLFWEAGYAWVLYEPEEVDRMSTLLPMLRDCGITPALLNSEATLQKLPILRGGELPAGAMFGRDAIVHHDAVVYAYRKSLLKSGVPITEGREAVGLVGRAGRITGVRLDDGEEIQAEAVVNAAGGWSREISALLGLTVPNTPVRREVLVTEPSRPFMTPAVTFYRPTEGWFNQTLRGELVAGAVDTAEAAGLNQTSTFKFVRRTAQILVRKAPRLANLRVIRQWAGVYDMTPDRMPIVGAVVAQPGFYQANGYSGRGFAFAPLVSQLLAEEITSGRKPELLKPFSPDRFNDQDKKVVMTDYYAGYSAPRAPSLSGEERKWMLRP